MRRTDCFDRVQAAVAHYRTVLKTVNVLIRLAEVQPGLLQRNRLQLSALRALPAELQDVYFARIFACFESDLRDYWRAVGRRTKPQTEHLLSAIATLRDMPQTTVARVQEVREYRNYLIHEQHQTRRPITIGEATNRINAYLAWLPLEW